MAASNFDYEKAAVILVDAMILGIKKAAENHGVSTRTIERWRARLKTDAKLAAYVVNVRSVILQPKVPTVVDALNAAIAYIQDAPKHLNPADRNDLLAMAQAYKILGEIQLAGKMIDARLAQIHQLNGASDRSVGTPAYDTSAVTIPDRQ